MAIILEIKVIPRARKQLYKPDIVYDLRCYLKNAPEDNKANNELIEFLAHELGIPKRSINLISGATTRIKRLSIEGFDTKEEILKKLAVEVQHALF